MSTIPCTLIPKDCSFWWCAEKQHCFGNPVKKKQPTRHKKRVRKIKTGLTLSREQEAILSLRKKNERSKKENILAKTGGYCWLCEEKIQEGEYSKDHKIPLSRGGSGKLENLWPAHIRCNGLKADYLIKGSEDFKTCFPDYKNQLSRPFQNQ